MINRLEWLELKIKEHQGMINELNRRIKILEKDNTFSDNGHQNNKEIEGNTDEL